MRARDLVDRIAAGDERVRAIQDIERRPQLGFPAGQHEFLRRTLARGRGPGVDAADEGRHNPFGVGAVACPLRVEIPAVLHAPRHRVALGEVGPQHFRQTALGRPPPQIQLKQPILRLHEPLGEEQIVGILRVDMRDSPPVADDADGSGDGGLDRTGYLRDERRKGRLAATPHQLRDEEREDRNDRNAMSFFARFARFAF